jgi:hypothetical protein
VLVVALTYRVKTWIERTSRVAEVIHTPRIGVEAGRRIAASKADAAVGVVELDMLSAGIADDLIEAGPRLVLTDASELFAHARLPADAAEIALATKAATIARDALAAIPRTADDLGPMLAAAETAARAAGVEEIYLAAAPDLARDQRLRRIEGAVAPGPSFAVRASVAYKGHWVRLVRTVGCGPAASEAAMAHFGSASKGWPVERSPSPFVSWQVDGCRLTQPLEPLLGSGIAPAKISPGMLVSVQARGDFAGTPVLIGAPMLAGGDLLVKPICD